MNLRYLCLSVLACIGVTSVICAQTVASEDPAARVQQDEPTSIAIVAVSVIDVERGRSIANQTVIVEGNRIVEMGAAEAVAVGDSTQQINGQGKFLIPGLWDMHVHWYDKSSMRLFTSNGVTGVRVMFGGPPHRAWRSEFAAGDSLGPRIVTAGPIVDGPQPFWPGSIEVVDAESGRAAVNRTIDLGADFVKVYSKLTAEGYRAIADEANSQGIRFAGHVPYSISAMEASELGQHSIEHLSRIADYCADPDLIDSETLGTLPAQEIWNAFSEERAAELFRAFTENQTWQCPTLVVIRNISQLHDERLQEDDRLALMPPNIRSMWKPQNDFRFRDQTEEDFQRMARSYEQMMVLAGEMNEAGVPMLAGTDTGNPFCYPGSSLHEELQLLVAAGLSPAQALETATLNPAKYLERESELGSVAVGKLADLVLLDANPLDDISHTTSIRGVMQNGRWLSLEDLQSIEDEIRDQWDR